ncbi:MAG: HlyD family efflux transporter periplasmic adaptor subunit [Cyclobacteriaceae bacterium]|nr:HlyD family efflux transporter periplasmic adaptor subunit [Cyclobacteriaceae bacterium]
MKYLNYLIALLPLIYGCTSDSELADAYGNFEAVEVIISSEANGKLISFALEEGDRLQAGQAVGLIDTTQLYLNKKQLEASIDALKTKTQNIPVQIKVLQKEKNNLLREKKRVENLLADHAATPRQYDDIAGQLDVVEQQIAATKSQLTTGNQGLLGEVGPLEVKIEQINDQLKKSVISNPLTGTVLSKFAYENEITSYGKPLYKIADLDNIIVRAYISGHQLSEVKIGQEVTIKIDLQDEIGQLRGKVTWISASAEFTPKVIQTREERVNLVYAIKVLVANDGSLKIGMPAEVYFD